MTFDDQLAKRVRDVLAEVPDVSERRMFGGLAFLVDGHMAW
jgi:TfoX/Sxy family transcriptional regulator of competence genes